MLNRGETRAKRRTRTFRPNYLSFAGTYQCNLACPHCCVPIEWKDRLKIDVALRFTEEAFQAGIRIIGFTGGEPFLYPEFLVAITNRASTLGFRFDKLMSNGVWWENEKQLAKILTQLKQAGFSGKLGLSVDKFHGIETPKLGGLLPHGPESLRSGHDHLAQLRQPRPAQRPRTDPKARHGIERGHRIGAPCSTATCS